MRKQLKRPRTFGRTKAKPYPQKKQEVQSMRLPEWKIDIMGEIFPGFADTTLHSKQRFSDGEKRS